MKAGFPVGKILLDVPSYGYAMTSTAMALTEKPDRRRNRTISTTLVHAPPPHQRHQDQLGNSSNTSAVLATVSPVPDALNTPTSSSSSDINLATASLSSSDASRPADVVTDGSGQVPFRPFVQIGALVRSTTTDTTSPLLSLPTDRPSSAADRTRNTG